MPKIKGNLKTLIRHLFFFKDKTKTTLSYNRLPTASVSHLRWSLQEQLTTNSKWTPQAVPFAFANLVTLHLLPEGPSSTRMQEVWQHTCCQSYCSQQRPWGQCLAHFFDCKSCSHITEHEFPELACVLFTQRSFPHPPVTYWSDLPSARSTQILMLWFPPGAAMDAPLSSFTHKALGGNVIAPTCQRLIGWACSNETCMTKVH